MSGCRSSFQCQGEERRLSRSASRPPESKYFFAIEVLFFPMFFVVSLHLHLSRYVSSSFFFLFFFFFLCFFFFFSFIVLVPGLMPSSRVCVRAVDQTRNMFLAPHTGWFFCHFILMLTVFFLSSCFSISPPYFFFSFFFPPPLFFFFFFFPFFLFFPFFFFFFFFCLFWVVGGAMWRRCARCWARRSAVRSCLLSCSSSAPWSLARRWRVRTGWPYACATGCCRASPTCTTSLERRLLLLLLRCVSSSSLWFLLWGFISE